MNWLWVICMSLIAMYFTINSILILVLLYHAWGIDELQNFARILVYTEWVELLMNFTIIVTCACTMIKWLCIDGTDENPSPPNQVLAYPPPPMNETPVTSIIQPPPLSISSNVNPYTTTASGNPFGTKYVEGYNPFGPEYNSDGS